MNTLPSSIESSMEEAGFTPTEVMVIRRLIDGEALSLRELAAKTGKSTGVLDQATRKLINKGILAKEGMNGIPKYMLQPLSAISQWMEQDMHHKRDTLHRKFQNFEAFMKTIEVGKKRPEMSFFNGREGMVRAYREILTRGKEFRHYMPLKTPIENDPLREFLVEYFRERRRRGIFSRVVVHNTPLGRRYQTRDPFEYRKTILVDEKNYPFTFEKIIVGNTVACFNHTEESACFLNFPDMAENERLLFDQVWKIHTEPQAPFGVPPAAASATTSIPVSTRTFSAVREFFLSRKSIATFGAFAVIAAGITYGLYRHTEALNLQRVRERVQSIAATAAFQFDAKDLDALRVESDWKKPQWAKVVNQLKEIRESNVGVHFAYIFRQSKSDPKKLEFVSDSHSLNPYANVDTDPSNDVNVGHEGSVEPYGQDLLQWPGQEYPDATSTEFAAFQGQTSLNRFIQTIFGNLITGYAPIKNERGEPVAVVAVDVDETTFANMNQASFEFIPYFLIAFFLFVMIRLMAFNQSLSKELWQILQIRKVTLVILFSLELSFGITYVLYLHTLNVVKEEVGQRLLSIVATAAPQFDIDDLEKLHWARDMKTDAYQRVFKKLNAMREKNKDIKYVYIQRATDREEVKEFVVDADTNFNLPFWDDANHDGIPQPGEYATPPGTRIVYLELKAWQQALVRPAAESDFESDQWGTYLSGYAPLKDKDGKTVAVLGVDMHVSDVLSLTRQKFSFWLWFLGSFGSLMLLYVLLERQSISNFFGHLRKNWIAGASIKRDSFSMLKEFLEFLVEKKILTITMVVSLCGLVITGGLYFYTVHLRTQEIGEKLAALAAVAAQQIYPDDLAKLHTPKDMKKAEYQRVFQILNNVRGKSSDIKYAYILRPTGRGPDDWEFVADADTNFNMPNIWQDINNDGKMDNYDQNVWPGFGYDISGSEGSRKALKTKQPGFEKAADKWGTYISGIGPIIKDENAIAVLGLDMDKKQLIEAIQGKYFPWWIMFGIYPVMVLLIKAFSVFKKPSAYRLW